MTRDQILAANDKQITTMAAPEWGGDVHVRVMSGADRDTYEQLNYTKIKSEDWRNIRARLVVRCLCDEQGNRLFSDTDEELLGAKSGAALDRVWDVCRRINGIGKDAAEETKKT